VADFFGGSGTTGVAAKRLGRRFILVDENPEATRSHRSVSPLKPSQAHRCSGTLAKKCVRETGERPLRNQRGRSQRRRTLRPDDRSGAGREGCPRRRYAPTDEWYVVPAHVVVAEVSQKRRGQHTENPFESATLSLNILRPWKVEDPLHRLGLRT